MPDGGWWDTAAGAAHLHAYMIGAERRAALWDPQPWLRIIEELCKELMLHCKDPIHENQANEVRRLLTQFDGCKASPKSDQFDGSNADPPHSGGSHPAAEASGGAPQVYDGTSDG